MMYRIRGLVYRLGFRPSKGSIFYSPTRDAFFAYMGALKAFYRSPQPAGSVLLSDGSVYTPYTPKTDDILELAEWCPLCKNTRLKPLDFSHKSCPGCHGEMYVGHDFQGLPALMFAPSE